MKYTEEEVVRNRLKLPFCVLNHGDTWNCSMVHLHPMSIDNKNSGK